jgi:hypothetical protein
MVRHKKKQARFAPGPFHCILAGGVDLARKRRLPHHSPGSPGNDFGFLGWRWLLRCHLFGFAFLAHELQFALGSFDLCRDFLLNAGCRFFQLR